MKLSALRVSPFRRSALVKASAFALLVCFAFAEAPANADDAYNQGVKSFGAKDYVTAANYFKKSLDSNALNANAYYYLGLSQHYQGDLHNAKLTYESLLTRFPGTQAAVSGKAALAQLLAKMPKSASSAAPPPAAPPGSAHSDFSSDFASLPREGRCRYVMISGSNHLYVYGFVNNRETAFIFDTGAEDTVLGKNNLKEVGMQPPSGKPTSTAMGIGGATGTWKMTANLRIGNIERRNFPIVVNEYMKVPLLGQSFFKDYQYTVEKNSHQILFEKRGQQIGSAFYNPDTDTNAVPFKREGNELLVQVEINGRPIWMYFDTGADGVTFPKESISQLGLTIPPDAKASMHGGVSGQVRAISFPLQKIKMGPIEKRNLEVSFVDQSLPHGLLGQTFFGDWQYKIDNDRRVIKFTRR